MDLDLPTESLSIRDTFARFFAAEATSARVRAAEPVGFDPDLWRKLVELGVPSICLDADAGGLSLFDGTLIMEEAGRRVVPAPIPEVALAVKLLDRFKSDVTTPWMEDVLAGRRIVALALRESGAQPQLVPGGAVAHAVIGYDGARLLLIEQTPADGDAPAMLAGAALVSFKANQDTGIVLASGPEAGSAWREAVEAWRLLTAAALIGIGCEAIDLAAAYARERIQFGVPIGVNQGVAHPLADAAIGMDAARLLLWRTLRAIADGEDTAGASASQLWWFTNRSVSNAVTHAVHVFGGYGLTNEYDVQLYYRRAKAWSLVLGDPYDALVEAGRRLYQGTSADLPSPGEVPVDFSTSPAALALADETRARFNAVLTPELRATAHHGIQTHDFGVSRALGAAGLLMPAWPRKWGGREVDRESASVSLSAWQDFEWTSTMQGTGDLVGRIIMAFASDEVQQEILPRMGAGEIVASLGYSEPSCGSDVFAAQTRAVRDGDDWVINGAKMFTSGAEIASYALLLTRTDPELPKHKGLTMFLVPLDSPGVEIQPVHTFMDERTNATFYTDVRIPDRYRLGPINGALKVMSLALKLEHGGASWHYEQTRLAAAVSDWAQREVRGGAAVINSADVLARIARVDAHARIGRLLASRAGWWADQDKPDLAYGPASKVFTTETFIADSRDMIDLTAPMSLVRGRGGLGFVEQCYRHSCATSVYGGTTEVLRSLVAERQLGMPRSRA